MTMADFVSISQIAGSAALIFTLIFVAAQVRQHTVASRARAFQASAEFWTRFNASLIDVDAGEAYAKGASGNHELGVEEFSRFSIVCRNALLGAENGLYQVREGLMNEDTFLGSTSFFRENVLRSPGFRAMWKLTRHHYGQEFRTFVDEQITVAAKTKGVSMREKWIELLAEELRETQV